MSKRSRMLREQAREEEVLEEEEIPEDSEPITCGICGTVSPFGTLICESCGGSLGNESPEEEIPEEPVEEPEEPVEPAIEEEIPEEQAEEDDTEPDTDDEEEEPDEPDEPEDLKDPDAPKVGKKLLIIGLLLSLSGIIGYLGLRMGFIQFLFGDSNPYPGIGSVEPSGHIVSSIPFVLGLVFIALWGIKNDPIYYELERIKKENEELEEAEEETLPEEFTEPLPEEEPIPYVEPVPEVEPDKELEELEVGGPQITSASVKGDIARELKVDRCYKMLSAVMILPDDRERLLELIETDISVEGFVHELKAAVHRRKEDEEKAAILEDEVVAELAQLENIDNKKGDDLKDEIIKEIEDLETQ